MWCCRSFPRSPNSAGCIRTSPYGAAAIFPLLLIVPAFFLDLLLPLVQGRAQVAAARFRRRGIPGDSDCRCNGPFTFLMSSMAGTGSFLPLIFHTSPC